ncbi:hypothetical protein NL676_021160 [Syzygium grande]|nr:hypothetical protein NL676_021160 [Syzygium grande]
MHGRPRMAPTREDAAASAAKAQKLTALQSQFLSKHHNHIHTYTKEALDTSMNLRDSINPEYYTAWNYTKIAVEHNSDEFVCASLSSSTTPRRCNHSDERRKARYGDERSDAVRAATAAEFYRTTSGHGGKSRMKKPSRMTRMMPVTLGPNYSWRIKAKLAHLLFPLYNEMTSRFRVCQTLCTRAVIARSVSKTHKNAGPARLIIRTHRRAAGCSAFTLASRLCESP